MVKAPWWEQTPGDTVALINSGKFAQAHLITISFASGAAYSPRQFVGPETVQRGTADATQTPSAIAWSPDSSTIAWISTPNGFIYTNRADGRGPEFLFDLNPDGIIANALVYSPDGTQIAIVGIHNGDFTSGIWLINSDGSGSPTRIFTDANGVAGIDWNATTNKILFNNVRDLYTINPDGSGQTAVTASTGTQSAEWGRFSPDGTQVVYEKNLGSPDFLPPDIYLINTDGTGDTELVRFEPDGYTRKPSWTPNGSRVAFTGGRRVQDILLAGATNSVDNNIASGLGHWFVTPEGANVHRWLTTMLKSPTHLLISPDGTKAAWLILSDVEIGGDAVDPSDVGLWVVSLPLAFRLREEIVGNPAIGPTPPPSNWILAGGFWNDSGVWIDAAAWED